MQWLATSTTLTAIVLAASLLSTRADAEETRQPNVLFLMADEHAAALVGASGHDLIKTPNLDALAKSGILFESTYCQNPICVPARASIAMGKMPSKVGVFDNTANKQLVLRNAPNSIARIFTGAGYTAEWIGKPKWGTSNTGLGFGKEGNNAYDLRDEKASDFESFKDEVGRLPENARLIPKSIKHHEDVIFTDHVISLLDEYSKGTKPFFLGLSLYAPHFPFVTEKKYYNMYKDVIDLPRVTDNMLKDLPHNSRVDREKYGFANLTESQIQKARSIYFGMISFADHQIGRVIQKLKETGLRENTIIVYTSDHGEMAGEHGLWYKNCFYEDAVKVPMILSYPDAATAKRKRVSSPTQLMDIVPTLYDLCNIAVPKDLKLDGKSLVPIILGTENGWKRQALSETYRYGAGRMIRFNRWKYCWYENGGQQLFDLRRDPAEEFNLYNNTKYAKVIRRLHRRVMKDYIPRPAQASDPQTA